MEKHVRPQANMTFWLGPDRPVVPEPGDLVALVLPDGVRYGIAVEDTEAGGMSVRLDDDPPDDAIVVRIDGTQTPSV